jgi:hypothetical protein
MQDAALSSTQFARWAQSSLRAILGVFRLECDGRAFEPTAMQARISSRLPVNESHPDLGIPASLAVREEPEIQLAWLTFRSILEHFELLVGGVVVEPTSFMLRCVEDWTFEQDSPAAMLAALARPCPYRCEFCYEDGLPDATRPKVRKRATDGELDFRMSLWRQGRDCAGFRGLRYGEILPHPRFEEALRTVRLVADRPIPIATAGAGLSEEALRTLAGRPRVLVQLSLNTCDPVRRERLMGDRKAAELMQLLPRFREYDVAWAASAVAWPGLSCHDLEVTIRVAEEHGALHFVIFLPSFSRYFPLAPAFDWEVRWREIMTFVRELRAKVCIPIRIAPDSWEAAHGFFDPLAVEVIGVTAGSPAFGKLRAGDTITAIGHATHAGPLTRPAANRALEQAWREKRGVQLRVRRTSQDFDVELICRDGTATPSAELDVPFGLHVYDGPDELSLARGVELLRFAGARRGWVLSAQLLAKPYEMLWQQCGQLPGAGDVELEFIPVANAFWGGNILVGDLLTVDDFVHAVRAEMDAGAVPPDALLVPFSPFHPTYWRDLTGASFLQIERRTSLPAFPLVTGSQP